MRALADERGVKATALMQAVRLAVGGSVGQPGLFEMMALVGRDAVIARLRRAAARPVMSPVGSPAPRSQRATRAADKRRLGEHAARMRAACAGRLRAGQGWR